MSKPQNTIPVTPLSQLPQVKPPGSIETKWFVKPRSMTVVRFDFAELGDPFFRLLNQPIGVGVMSVESMMTRLNESHELKTQLTQLLDRVWGFFQFKGVIMMYSNHLDIRNAYSYEAFYTPKLKQDDDGEEVESILPDPKDIPQTLRSIDLAFVLNVLCRTRGNILASNTELALETHFLSQCLLCDDPRLVEFSQATGTIVELL
jgi:hypothetical protein